ncbi:MARVEL domain-containing protein 3 [Rhynchocyon petersi]
MEPPRAREPRPRPRERDPGRQPRPGREQHPDRQRERAGERRRERGGDGGQGAERRGARDPGRDRDARREPPRPGGHRPDEQRAAGKARQSRPRDGRQGHTWDTASPWEVPAQRKEDSGRRGPDSCSASGRYVPPNLRPGQEEVEYYQSEAEGLLECHKCRYLCTGRACCQMLEVLLNLLILACSSVSYTSTGGYTGITSLGGIYYYQYGGAYSGFHGADGEKAQQLDIQFYQLKLPTVTAAMAYSGALMTFCCLLILLGVLQVLWHCPLFLVVEGVLDGLLAVAYIPALYFYFHYLSAAYGSPVCKQREALYQSKGYSGFSCSFHGGDIGAAIFAALGIVVFAFGAILAIRGYRKVRTLKGEPAEMLVF